ncbi:hypothetical protein [Nocardia seriolae]|uniref:Uncharacterized protein n=1 Tax=Nocardia seriolae TaxID=37332 RepID=A0A0B8NJZ8_9NOCA|nr:hypothetical protein [Nocardia seriolae]APA98934.1 hypothetical protein NS506_04888 [Nocardia seriolae]MTJ63989.1 hypothetical protein [Nocardia seriolae]MTJ71343.1 hypothetical protein [Nocardia seriolae]MTJ88550.1 hypothetical protein [Nocardia seriolae]MTK32534.1 hypothetical protein [Nocardia seriolae]
MTTPGRATQQRRQPAATAARKRTFGPPDMFVWAPVLTLFLTAGIVGTIGQSLLFAAIFVAVAVVMVVADMWFNR